MNKKIIQKKKSYDSADVFLKNKKENSLFQENWAPPMQSIPELRFSQDFEMNDELAMEIMNIKNQLNEKKM